MLLDIEFPALMKLLLLYALLKPLFLVEYELPAALPGAIGPFKDPCINYLSVGL